MNLGTKIITGALLASGFAAQAETFTWIGGASGAWESAANWSHAGEGTQLNYPNPNGGDDVIIDGTQVPCAVTVKASSVYVVSLAVSGTAQLVGPGFIFIGPVQKGSPYDKFSAAAGGIYTWDIKVILAGGSPSETKFGGTHYFNKGFETWTNATMGPERITIGGGGDLYVRNVPANLTKTCVSSSTIHLEVAGNVFKRVELQSAAAVLHVETDDPWILDDADYFAMAAGSKLYLHGHDVKITPYPILGTSGSVTTGCITNSNEEGSCVLTLENTSAATADRVNKVIDVAGPISVVICDGSDTADICLDRQASFSGDLVVSNGTLSLSSNASFPNAASICIAQDGRINLAAGLSLDAKKLRIGDFDTDLPDGTYGTTASGALFKDDVHFGGTGVVLVDNGTAVERRICVKDGNSSDPSVWDPAGIPKEGETLVLSNRTLFIDSPLTAARVELAGEVTLSGAQLTLQSDPTNAWASADGGTYDIGCKVVFSRVYNSDVPFGGTVRFGGGFVYPGYFQPSVGELHFTNTPIQVKVGLLAYTTVFFEVASNELKRVEVLSPSGDVHVMVDDPWIAGTTGWDFSGIFGGGRIHLHGHRVHMPVHTFIGNNRTGAIVSSFDTETPATLILTESIYDARTNSVVDFTGPMTVRMTADSTTGWVQNCAASATGDLIVEGGTLEFTENGSWANAPNVTVTGDGRISIRRGETFGKTTNVRLSSLENLDIASGVVQRVASLTLNGVTQPNGRYVCGGGQLLVRGGGMMIIFR